MSDNMRITVTVEGVEQTIGAFNKYDMETRERIKEVVTRSAKAVRRTAKAIAPVGPTGNFKRSISIRVVRDMDGLSKTVVPRQGKAPHRHLVHEGTGRRSTSSGANRGVMPANPVMARAQASEQGTYQAEIRRIINRDVVI